MTHSSSDVNLSPALPTELFSQVLADGVFVQCTLSKRRSASAVEYRKVTARLVAIKDQTAVQLTYHFQKKETHENLSEPEAAARLRELLQTEFEHGHLFTAKCDYVLRGRADGSFKVKRHAPTKQPSVRLHDREKHYLIPEGTTCPFLVEIGVMTADGAVRAAKRKKFRQINRYLEIVNDIVEHLPRDRRLRVIDFGCGKSYLTFALHHLLTVIHDFDVEITGLDREPSVIATCQRVAEKLHCRGLRFETGNIDRFADEEKVDLSVSLHACDTATDDAIAQSVRWNADVILAVPCCQHEFASSIQNQELRALTEHGILKERFAAVATDAFRATALGICDYATSVVEFIDMEHTAKNVLLRAVKQPANEVRRTGLIAEYRALKQLLSIERPHLERVLPELAKRVKE